MRLGLRIYLCLSVFICGRYCSAQELKVSLLTVGPGAEVYELFGHNAILFENPGSGRNVAFNWGVFDFNQPNFIGRFIMGRMEYSIGEMTREDMLEEYQQQKRMVVVTELKLTAEQKQKLLDLCYENAMPGKREYRYDYYGDNCSSRVRDMLDRATDGQLAAALKGKPAQGNLRWHTDRLCRQTPWLYVALHYVLGHPVDRSLDAWGESFLPSKLHQHLGEAGMLGEETVLVPDASGYGLEGPREPPEWKGWFLLAGLVWGGAIAGLVRVKGKLWWRVGMLLGVAWAGLCVVGGGISTWGWVFTDHVVSRWNENWLQLSPVSVLVLIACGMAVIGRDRKWGVGASGVIVGLSVVGVGMKILPMMRQPNWEIILLALPVHLGVAAALRYRALRYRLAHRLGAKHGA